MRARNRKTLATREIGAVLVLLFIIAAVGYVQYLVLTGIYANLTG
jgi:hypothetical protein